MKTIYTAIGGRMTKWKGKVVSFAPYVSASIAMGVAASAIIFGSAAVAQEVTYTDGSASTITSAEKITSNYQLGSGDIEAMITSGSVTSSANGANGAITTDLLANAITATGLGNTATASLDLSLAMGTGSTSNAVIASALENLGNDAFAQISGSSIASTVAGGTTGASASVSSNTIATSITLAKSTNMLEGSISTTFANTDAGSLSITATDYGLTSASSSAGLVLQSTQLNEDVQNATANYSSAAAFSNVTNSDIDLGVSGGSATSLLSLDSNSISATFKGTSAANTLYVTEGGLATLSSTAGISNVQVSENVGTSWTAGASPVGTELSNAVITATSGIAATVTGNLDTTSVELTSNSMATTAAQNTASNTLYVADGISVDASGAGTTNAATNIDLASSAATADIDVADLFVSNVQASVDSSIISETNGADGITLSSAGNAETVSVSATSNTVSATTTGNKNTGNLIVAGANDLNAVVAQTNVQSFLDSTSDDIGNSAQAAINDPLLSVTVASDDTAATTVESAAISLSSNAVTASATANTATLSTSLAGNSVTDGVAASTGIAPTTAANKTGTASVTAGFSSVSTQTAKGDADTDASDYVADSQITDAAGGSIGLTVGNAGDSASSIDGTILQNSTLDMSSNAVTSAARANTATQSLTVSANDLATSAAVLGQQTLTGGVLSAITGTSMASSAIADGTASTDVTNLTMSADSNAVTSTAVGNTASNTLSASATTLTAVDLVVAADLTDSRTALQLDSLSAGTATGAAAISLLNSQYSTSAKATDAIGSTIDDAGISVSLTPDAQTAGSTVTNLTMSLDSNSIGATARANLATNAMTLDFASLSLTSAAYDSATPASAAGGTNIAVLGSSQVNTLGVTASVDAGSAASDLTAEVTTGTGAIDTSSISASSNAITALASGNGVTNTFALSGTAIQTPDANAGASNLTVVNASTTSATVTAFNTAFAVGNEQANSGDITASIGAGAGETIGATALGARTVTDSTISADGNRVVAQAVAASDATTTSTVDATAIATSFMAGSRQLNTGAVEATVGATGGLTIEAMTSTSGTVDSSSVTASGNVIGATATATSDVLRLTLGGSTTATLDGSGTVGATEPYAATAATSYATADFAQIESQTNTGSVTATTTDASVLTQTGTTTDSSLASNSNVLTAMATGISGTTAITGTAASIGGTTAPTFALIADQTSSGAITGTLDNAAVNMTAANTDTTSNSESLSLNANSLSAYATAITASNTLTTSSDGQTGGLQDMDQLRSYASGSGGAAVAADRALVSDQTSGGIVTSSVSNGAEITMDVTAATAGSLLSVASNAISGTATGANAANTINSLAGGENAASVGLASSQIGTAAIISNVDVPTVSVELGDAVSSTAVDIASNAVTATATGLNGTNRIAVTGGSIAPINPTASGADTSTSSGTPSIDYSFAALSSYQAQSAAVSSTINDSGAGVPATLKLAVTGLTSDSALALTSNSIAATAAAGTVTNVLSQVSATSVDFGNTGSGLASVQYGSSAANVTSTIESASIAMTGAAVTDSTIAMTENRVTASATGFSATNANTLSAGTAMNGDDVAASGTLTDGALVASNLSSVVSNTQTNLGDVTATVTTAGTGASAPQVSVTVGAVTDSSIDVSSNTMRAQATGLSADNRSAISGGSLDDFSALEANYQSQTGVVLANLASPQFSITSSGNVAGTVTADGNIGVASATGTTATNRLAVTSDTSITGTATGLVDKEISISALDLSTLSADDTTSLMNSQSGSSNVTASINDDNAAGDVLIGADITGTMTGSISADSNILVAQARGNVADSAYTMAAGTSIAGATQGLLASSQMRSAGSLVAEIDPNTLGQIGVDISSTATGSISVSGNTVRATGTANLALNSMSISAASGIDQLAASAGSSGSVTSGVTTITNSAQYAVMNAQSNGSAATSSLNDFAIGVAVGGSANSGSLALNGNMMMADTTGNNAVNSVMLASGGSGADASASISNYQTNSAAMTSTISNAEIAMSTGSMNGSVSASNNAISASAVGNTSSSTIGTNGSAFKSF